MAEIVTWIDAGNVSYAWDGSNANYLAIIGRAGAFAPAIQVIEQEVPLQPGARIRLVKTPSRPIKIPLLVRASSESVLATTRRTIEFALNPLRGPGTLQIQANDGTTRQMTCYCEAGREGDEADTVRGPGWVVLPLQFRALDPYFYDLANTSVTQTTFPATFTQTNNGDEQAWPIWTITGPGTNPSITNNTTGKVLNFPAYALLASQVLTIDTRPTGATAKTITRENGSNQFSQLASTASLWPLVTGGNSITITMTGTTGASQVQLQYKQAWDGF